MNEKKDNFYTPITGVYEKKIKEDLKEKIKPLPKTYDTVEDWKNDVNHKLQERGSPDKVMNPIWHNFVIVALILVIVGGVFFFMWGTYNDKYKGSVSVNQTVSLEPQINVTSNTENEFSFTPSTNNKFENNYTIIIHNHCGGNSSG